MIIGRLLACLLASKCFSMCLLYGCDMRCWMYFGCHQAAGILEADTAAVQVVNADDLEEVLGPRPFKSAELRNIDKFRDGFSKKLIDNPSTPSTPSSTDNPVPGVVDVPEAPESLSGSGVEKPGGAGVSKQTAQSTSTGSMGRITAS